MPELPGAIRTIGLVVNSERDGAIELALDLAEWMRAQGIGVSATRSLTPVPAETEEAFQSLVDKSDLIVVMGGDGSLLGASRRAGPAGKPILGIHYGGMGFLNECRPENAREAITRVLRGDYTIDERMMLRAELWHDGASSGRKTALNDVAVTRETLSRILRLEVQIADETVATYQGDGILVSTPTGSTGHALSAGGPVMDPRVDALSITPICAHSVNARPVIVPATERVRIRHFSPLARVIVTIDGQEGMPMHEGDCLEVTRAPWSARLVRLGYTRFYHHLRDRLHWQI
jgi:NAD+ kinase